MSKRKSTPDPDVAAATNGAVPGQAHLRNRVVERRRMLGSELAPNPKNWREHGPEQTEALNAVLREIGMAGELLAYQSERNGGRLTLINGHKRSADFPTELWDVAITDLNDAEADRLLAVLDPIVGMATTDPAKLTELVNSIDADTSELQKLLDQIQAEAEEVTFEAVEDGAEGPNRSEGFEHHDVKIKPVLSVAQVKVFEEAILATDMLNRGEAILEICKVYLEQKKR